MILNETQQKWANIISEEYGVKDQNKLSWMSQYAQNHEIHESVQDGSMKVSGGIYSTPLNTMGLGDPKMPSNAGVAGGLFGTQVPGSGDIPMSTLTMALEVAAVTIGLELVPVIPANGPWAMLSYMDTPYAGGKLNEIGNLTSLDGKGPDAENKPIYVKVNASWEDADWAEIKKIKASDNITVTISNSNPAESATHKLEGKYIGYSRIEGAIILKVTSAIADSKDASIADVMRAATVVKVGTHTAKPAEANSLKAELVATDRKSVV